MELLLIHKTVVLFFLTSKNFQIYKITSKKRKKKTKRGR